MAGTEWPSYYFALLFTKCAVWGKCCVAFSMEHRLCSYFSLFYGIPLGLLVYAMMKKALLYFLGKLSLFVLEALGIRENLRLDCTGKVIVRQVRNEHLARNILVGMH